MKRKTAKKANGKIVPVASVKGQALPAYVSESKSMFVLVFLIKLIPWLGYFAVSNNAFLFIAPVVRAFNLSHFLIMLAFPLWVGAIFYIRKVASVKDRQKRLLLYFVCWYLILTPAMVLLAIVINQPPQLFQLITSAVK